MTQAKPGFSILELMIYLAIVGILMAALGPRLKDAFFKGREFTAKSTIATLVQAIHEYQFDLGRYPTTKEGLEALIDQRNEPNWRGPYLRDGKGVPLDPWSREYEYHSPATEFKQFKQFEVFSRGANPDDPRRAIFDGE